MPVKPIADRVLVKPIQGKRQTDTGIILPEDKRPVKGTVIAVGRGGVDSSGVPVLMQVKAGDKVLYGKFSGTEILIDGETHLIMKEGDIFAVID